MKINDLRLFGHVLLQICPILFMTNHHSYSKWMTLYALELLNLENKKPDVELQLRSVGFSVNQLGRKFSNIGVDMAIGQTINAEAKSRLKGIIDFVDISSAVNRWITSNSMRSEIVNNVLQIADLDKPINGTKVLRAPRIAKDKVDVQKVKKLIKDTLNPFDESANDDALFNIRTSRKLEIEGETYLLTSANEGVNIRDKFIEECQNNPQRFEEAISKQKISNFATESLKKKNKSNQVAIISNVKGTRDLFGRLLYLALRSLVDLNIVFQYPLLPEPPCFTHPDGSLRESKKSTVFHFLKHKVKTESPSDVHTFIADGTFIVRSSNSLENATFLRLQESYLQNY